MKKIIASILIALTVSTVFVVKTYSQEANLDKFVFESKVFNSEMLSKKLVRFHVIANSDTEIDQNVKLKVKDAVLQDMVPKLNVSKSKEETIDIINQNAENIEMIAEKTLRRNNMSNDVTVVLNKTFFPTKYYKDFSLPAGDYLALRVIIGDGEGKNWWCVLFPPLCLVDVKKGVKEEVKEPVTKVKDLEKTEVKAEKSEIADLEYPTKQEEILDEKLEKKLNIDLDEKQDSPVASERPQIRWKALELLGFYKNLQDR